MMPDPPGWFGRCIAIRSHLPKERIVYAPHRDRTVSALGSLAVVALIGCVLVLGLRPGATPTRSPALPAFDLTPERPPPPPPRQHQNSAHADRTAAPRLAGAAAPPPAILVPAIVLPAPVVVLAQPHPGTGDAPELSPRPGTGTGGGGDGGTGVGGGDSDDGIATGAEQIKGRLTPRDLPPDALPPGGQLSVGVSYMVGTDGRVSNCAITRTSGDAVVDSRVCQLLTDRFRYRPARDRAGTPVATTIRETHSWARKPETPRE